MNDQNLEVEADWSLEARGREAIAASKAVILVAVDFSPDSEAALRWACRYAAAIAAPLEIVHVVHDPASSPGTYKPNGDNLLEPMVDVAQRKLAEFLEKFDRSNPQLPVLEQAKKICVPGLPVQRILDVAQARGAGLLVLGSRRHSGLGQLLQGSTASQITRQAGLPVTIVKADGG